MRSEEEDLRRRIARGAGLDVVDRLAALLREQQVTSVIPSIEERIAINFSAVLRDWLTSDEFVDLIAWNRSEPDSRVCHSHDFCDATKAMSRAFQIVLGRDGTAFADVALWTRAWGIAKAAEFDMRKIGADR